MLLKIAHGYPIIDNRLDNTSIFSSSLDSIRIIVKACESYTSMRTKRMNGVNKK